MNLINNASREALQLLLAGHDDDAGYHVLWADAAGNVHLVLQNGESDSVRSGIPVPALFVQFDEFPPGHGCVGSEAASDPAYLDELLTQMTSQWNCAVSA